MREIQLQFAEEPASCVFPTHRAQLPQAFQALGLESSYPVIVLIGGFIRDEHRSVTYRAIETLAAFADDNRTLIICGGSALGVMAAIGSTRLENRYTFPLLGINIESLVTWPNGPRNRRFLWWGTERFPLATGYSHFILVPGSHYGDDSPWLAEAAAQLSKDHKSLTVLANGGNVSRTDIALSLEQNRPVIVLAGTGRLADELANQTNKPAQITAVKAEDELALINALQMTFDMIKEKL